MLSTISIHLRHRWCFTCLITEWNTYKMNLAERSSSGSLQDQSAQHLKQTSEGTPSMKERQKYVFSSMISGWITSKSLRLLGVTQTRTSMRLEIKRHDHIQCSYGSLWNPIQSSAAFLCLTLQKIKYLWVLDRWSDKKKKTFKDTTLDSGKRFHCFLVF